jgi:membrane protease YdiL (CAAX protease family)
MTKRLLIRTFLILSFILSWGVFGPISYFFVSNTKSDIAQGIFVVMMFIPTLVTFILTKYYKLGWKGYGLKFKNWHFLILSILIVLGYSVFEMVLQSFFKTTTYNITKDKYLFALTVMVPVNSLVTSVFAFGEELGWRGFLQNLLISKYGLHKGILILGIVWGFWHLPVALLGYNLPEYPVIEALIWYPLFCISLSYIFAWLTLKGKSVWWAVLAHGANNGIATLIEGKANVSNKPLSYLIGILVTMSIGFIFFLLLQRMKRKNEIELYLPEKIKNM